MGMKYEKENNYTSPITAAVATMAMLFAPMAEAQSLGSSSSGSNQRYAQQRKSADVVPTRDTRRDDCIRLIRDLPAIMRRTQNSDYLEEVAGCEDYPGFQNVVNVANEVDAARMAAARRRTGQQ